MEARGTKKCYQNSFLSDLLFMQENIQVNLKKNYKIDIVWQHILVSKNNYEIIYGWLKMTVATNTLVFLTFVGSVMVFCYQNCPDLLWEKIVLVIEKFFWNSRLKAKNLEIFWDHQNNLFKQWKVRIIFCSRMIF